MKQRRVKLQKKNSKLDDSVFIELDTRCSCSPSSINEHASIQFSRRYLECQGSMPIRVLREFIERILPHSPTTEVSIYDSADRLLNDSDRLKEIFSSSSSIVSLRFTLMNTITSLGHCICSSPSMETDCSSFSPTIIRRETINRTLSTCPLVPTPPYSPSSSLSTSPRESSTPIVNLLTPPSPRNCSSFLIENLVQSKSADQSMIDQITSEFGEICPTFPSTKTKRCRTSKKSLLKTSLSDGPLDLTVKKRPLSFDLFSTQSKWLKMI